MKIGLNLNNGQATSGKDAQLKALANLINIAKRGDWKAKEALHKQFHHLLEKLAQKRTQDPKKIQELIEKGKKGIDKAVLKFKDTKHPEKFQLFILDYIENSMDKPNGGFFSRLFGK